MSGVRLTERGWAVLTALCSLVAFLLAYLLLPAGPLFT